MRNIEIPFSEFRKYLEERGIVFEEGEYISNVSWQMTSPEEVITVSIDH